MQKLRFLRRKLARVNPKDTIEEALFGQGCIQERNAQQRKVLIASVQKEEQGKKG